MCYRGHDDGAILANDARVGRHVDGVGDLVYACVEEGDLPSGGRLRKQFPHRGRLVCDPIALCSQCACAQDLIGAIIGVSGLHLLEVLATRCQVATTIRPVVSQVVSVSVR